eukprot:4348547-Lingulodinium_polyedra.AAC.1
MRRDRRGRRSEAAGGSSPCGAGPPRPSATWRRAGARCGSARPGRPRRKPGRKRSTASRPSRR